METRKFLGSARETKRIKSAFSPLSQFRERALIARTLKRDKSFIPYKEMVHSQNKIRQRNESLLNTYTKGLRSQFRILSTVK
jgi:hypothetical protein